MMASRAAESFSGGERKDSMYNMHVTYHSTVSPALCSASLAKPELSSFSFQDQANCLKLNALKQPCFSYLAPPTPSAKPGKSEWRLLLLPASYYNTPKKTACRSVMWYLPLTTSDETVSDFHALLFTGWTTLAPGASHFQSLSYFSTSKSLFCTYVTRTLLSICRVSECSMRAERWSELLSVCLFGKDFCNNLQSGSVYSNKQTK